MVLQTISQCHCSQGSLPWLGTFPPTGRSPRERTARRACTSSRQHPGGAIMHYEGGISLASSPKHLPGKEASTWSATLIACTPKVFAVLSASSMSTRSVIVS